MTAPDRSANDAARSPRGAADSPSLAFTDRFGRWGPAAVVYGMMLATSAVQAPVPGVNEPQYLGKAKHFWDPTWAAGDYFLDTSNPHLVFYFAVGWLTRFLTLDATAWIARAVGYAVVAVGWTMLAGRVTRSPWAAVPSAAIFLLLASVGNFSGEWLVGGIEGKVFSYGLLFAAIALRLDRRLMSAAACLGGAVSFHPVVGMWGVVCAVAAEGVLWWTGRRQRHQPETPPSPSGLADEQGSAVQRLLLPAGLFLMTALPGLIPALLTLDGATPLEASRANYLQVFVRLKHHLDPTQFPATRYAGYGLLFAAWLALESRPHRDDRQAAGRGTWFRTFVVMSVLAALAGVVVGWHLGSAWTMPLRDLRGTLLKFYPFRLADVFVPLAFSLAATRRLIHGRGRVSPHFRPGGVLVPVVVTLATYAASLAIVSPDRNPSRMSPEQLADWLDVAGWAREETPPGTVFVTPSRMWGFKWYSHRAEYVNFKDAPQDAAGLLEWEQRLDVLKHWWESSTDGRYTADDLRRLGEMTEATYLVTPADANRFTTSPVYENRWYRVYALQ